MRFIILICGLACGLWMCGKETAVDEDYARWIFPDPDQTLLLVEAYPSNNGGYWKGHIMNPENPMHDLIWADLSYPLHQSTIKLIQCAKNFAGRNDDPNVVFLSDQEGGLIRRGKLRILDSSEHQTYNPDFVFVELKLDEPGVARGDLHILAHEFGHVMMEALFTSYKDYGITSSMQHASMGTTDYPTAFYEGWGIHFQVFSDTIKKYSTHLEDSFMPHRWLGSLWHSNIDSRLRIQGVKQNLFIYEKLLHGKGLDTLDVGKMVVLEHTWPVFSPVRLANAQQLFSREGFMATMFYRINTDKRIIANYSEKSFYSNFLLKDLPDDVKPEEVFTPFENVVLKHFYVWHSLEKDPLFDIPLPVAFIKRWCHFFPEDKQSLLEIFISLSNGVSMDTVLSDLFGQLAFYGITGDLDRFLLVHAQYAGHFLNLLEKAKENPAALGANVGPTIWIANHDLTHREVLWQEKPRLPLRFNLNTASVYDIATLPWIDIAKAEEIIRHRKRLGYFSSIDQLTEYGFSRKEIKNWIDWHP